ncbi:MAG: FtsK/SpoIIIE domain-containing protein, partial [Gemmataceae bacterium]
KSEAEKTPRMLIVHGVHRFRELRKNEDDFGFGRKSETRSPAELFSLILRDGPLVGIHTICWCDTLTNLNRSLDRSLLREFGLRVLFQMSPTDSSHLIDSPAASRLGRDRALFVEETLERPEKFRPYAMADASWLRSLVEALPKSLAPTPTDAEPGPIVNSSP